MVKRIVAFGDSWTYGHGVEEEVKYKEQASPPGFIESLRSSNSWVRWLAQKYDVPYVNLGKPGICNVQIRDIIKDNVQYLNKESDLIIIMFTFPYRHFLWINSISYFDRPFPNHILSINDLLGGYNYYMVNSFYPMFKDEPGHKEGLELNRFLEIDRSAADLLYDYEEENNTSPWEYGFKGIRNIESSKFGDYHPNLLGYRLISDWIFNLLQKRGVK